MSTQRGFSVPILLFFVVLIGSVIGAGLYVASQQDEPDDSKTAVTISSFEECAAAGYPVAESYPEQCTVPGGETFVRNLTNSDSQEDAAVKNMAARTISALSNYAGNNRGKFPAFEELLTSMSGYDLPEAEYVNGVPQQGEIQYVQEAECIDGTLYLASSKRQIAVQVLLSDGTLYCTDNS